MDDRKAFRFTDKERVVLFSLFDKYKDIIDIRHRRYSQSQHKQMALRNCWNTILDSFNADPNTNKRTMKQIQKFWLNSKLRNRLPGDSTNEKSPDKKLNSMVKIKVVPSTRKTVRTISSDEAYQALAKSCNDSENDENDNDEGDDDDADRKDIIHTAEEIEMNDANGSGGEQYAEDQYDHLSESYFPSDAITLKVINDQIDLALAAPAPSSIVTIPTNQSQRTATLVTLPGQSNESQIKKGSELSSPPPCTTSATTTYITYSPIKDSGNQNIQLVKSANGSYLITAPATTSSPQQQTFRNARLTQSSISPLPIPVITQKDEFISPTTHPIAVNDGPSLQELQKQEQQFKLREAKLRCEVQEIEKEKAKEELIQMREIHRMKIKEMEMRLRNIERS